MFMVTHYKALIDDRRSLVLSRLGHRLTTYATDAVGTGNLNLPLEQPLNEELLDDWYFPRWWFGWQERALCLLSAL